MALTYLANKDQSDRSRKDKAMISIRAILNPKNGLNMEKGPSGLHTMVRVGAFEMPVYLRFDDGVLFLPLNSVDPQIPKELRPYITKIVSVEHVQCSMVRARMLKIGLFTSKTGHATASVKDEFMNGARCFTIVIKARSLRSWSAFRNQVEQGTARMTRSLDPQHHPITHPESEPVTPTT